MAEHTPETEEYGISSFTYLTSHPFDAEKLWTFLNDDENWNGVLRSKGYFWVAADHRIAYEWGQAGGASNVSPTGMWFAAIPPSEWDLPEGEPRPDHEPDWHHLYGDRKQQLVFIGQKMDEASIRTRLDACLLDEQLAKAERDNWAGLENPFPELLMETESV